MKTLAALACGAAIATAPASACTVPANASALRAEVVARANAQREDANRAALTTDARLREAAQAHACWMADTGTFSHTGQGESNHADRARSAGYRYGFLAENIAYGHKTPEQLIGRWMQSRDHKKNLMHRKAQDTGVGLAAGADGRLYWVMMYARAK